MNLMEIITGSKRWGLHFQIQIRLVWEGHSSCTPDPDENSWPGCLVRSACAEAKDGTPCTCHLQGLGKRICASPHVLALLHKRCPCLEPQPKSDFIIVAKDTQAGHAISRVGYLQEHLHTGVSIFHICL